MDFDSPDTNIGSTPRKLKDGPHFYPVSPGGSGEGLPYAPEDWPNPGDKWRWKAGKRVKGSGYIWDRYLYLPNRLLKAGQPKYFRSKFSVEQYVQSAFPGTDVKAFFASFRWSIPSKQFNKKVVDNDFASSLVEAEILVADSHLAHTCKAGNNMCISSSGVSDPPLPEAMFCDICCNQPDFCRNCCCILCSKTISSAFGSYNYIRCKAILVDGCICGHIAHINCALQAHMVGTVGGSYDLDAEYFCRRCDSKTDLVSHIMELLKICESIDSRDEIETILNSAISILQGSKKLNARQLIHHIESVMAKLKDGANFEDMWKKEESVLEVLTAQPKVIKKRRTTHDKHRNDNAKGKRQRTTTEPNAHDIDNDFKISPTLFLHRRQSGKDKPGRATEGHAEKERPMTPPTDGLQVMHKRKELVQRGGGCKQVRAESSRRHEQEEEVEQEEQVHEDINMDSDEEEEQEPESVIVSAGGRETKLSAHEAYRYKRFKQTDLGTVDFVHPPDLEPYGCMEEFMELTQRGNWKILFDMREIADTPILYEVLATMDVKHDPKDTSKKSIKFQAFGKEYSLSVDELGYRMGFYKWNDLKSPEFKALLKDFPSLEVRREFWELLTRKGLPFQPSRSHATEFNKPIYKILYRLISHGINGRSANDTKVYSLDLFALWSIVTDTPIHMGWLFNKMFYSSSRVNAEKIFAGPFVTRLLKGYKLDAMVAGDRTKGEISKIEPETYIKMKLTRPGPPPPVPPQNYEAVPQDYPPVQSWADLQAYQYRFHMEVMGRIGDLLMRQNEMNSAVIGLQTQVSDLTAAPFTSFPTLKAARQFLTTLPLSSFH